MPVLVRPFVDHPGARPPGAGTLPTLAAALTALGTYRARLTDTGLLREFVEAGRLRSEGVEPRSFASAVEPADLVELTRLATDVKRDGRGEVQYRVHGAQGHAVRAGAGGGRPRRHGRRRDRGRGQRARAPAARGDDRAAADRARGAPLHGLVRQRGHLPRDLSEPERQHVPGRGRGGRERRELDGGGAPRRPRRLRGVHDAADGERPRERRVPPLRRRRRHALDARALEEPAAPWRCDRGHRHRDGHLDEPRGGRGAGGQRGQAGARAQGGRRLCLRARRPTSTATGRRSAPAPTASGSRAARSSTGRPRAPSGSP